MKINDLPEIIKKIALFRQGEQGNDPNGNVYLDFTRSAGGFDWDLTREGQDIWNDVNSNDFESFYLFHSTDMKMKAKMKETWGEILNRIPFHHVEGVKTAIKWLEDNYETPKRLK